MHPQGAIPNAVAIRTESLGLNIAQADHCNGWFHARSTRGIGQIGWRKTADISFKVEIGIANKSTPKRLHAKQITSGVVLNHIT